MTNMMWSKPRFGSEYIVRFRVSKSVVGDFDRNASDCLGRNGRETLCLQLFANIYSPCLTAPSKAAQTYTHHSNREAQGYNHERTHSGARCMQGRDAMLHSQLEFVCLFLKEPYVAGS